MQAIQSLILPQTMSPDNSSLPVAGFTRTFSIASLIFLLSFVFLDVHLRFPPSSLRFTYLHYLFGFVTDVFLVGLIVLRSSGLAASNRQFIGVVVVDGYVCSSRTFSCWRVGTCCDGSWLRLWKSVLRHREVLAEGLFSLHFRGISMPFPGSHFHHLIQSQ